MPVLSAHDVASELRRRLPNLPTKKLHKLLYYCQGHHLAQVGEPLFSETISAWDMGPVVGTLWHREKTSAPLPAPAELDEAQLNTIGYVLSRYGGLTGADLQALTHSGAPWRDADRTRGPGTSARIPLEALRTFFAADEADGEDEDMPLPDSEAVAEWLADAPVRATADSSPDSIEALRARLA